jgi:hypothetical protein
MTDFTEGQLIALLKGLYEIKRQRNDLDDAYKKASEPVRAWLDAHPGEQLYDGESRIVARLQDRTGAPELDVISLYQKDPETILGLASFGCLKLDAKAWQAIQGKSISAENAKPYLMPGKASVALILDKEK